MKVVWTPKAIAGWREVADYINVVYIAEFWDVRKNRS